MLNNSNHGCDTQFLCVETQILCVKTQICLDIVGFVWNEVLDVEAAKLLEENGKDDLPMSAMAETMESTCLQLKVAKENLKEQKKELLEKDAEIEQLRKQLALMVQAAKKQEVTNN